MASSPRTSPGLPAGGLPVGGLPVGGLPSGGRRSASTARLRRCRLPAPLRIRSPDERSPIGLSAPRTRPSAARTRFRLAAPAAARRPRDGSR